MRFFVDDVIFGFADKRLEPRRVVLEDFEGDFRAVFQLAHTRRKEHQTGDNDGWRFSIRKYRKRHCENPDMHGELKRNTISALLETACRTGITLADEWATNDYTMNCGDWIVKLIPLATSVVAKMRRLVPPLQPVLSINAVGEVPTAGWTNVRLSPVVYARPPDDGIWEFDLIGDEPNGMTEQVISPVGASARDRMPDWCIGVRVRADKNAQDAKVVDLGHVPRCGYHRSLPPLRDRLSP